MSGRLTMIRSGETQPRQTKNAKTNYDRASSEYRRSSKLVSVKPKQPPRLIITKLFGS